MPNGHGGQTAGAGITAGPPSTASSRRSPFRPSKRPASEWHSDGSKRRLVGPSQQSNPQPRSWASSSTPAPPRSRPSPLNDQPDESLDHKVMALDIKERGTVGCAYYVAREERLFCMEDLPKGGLDMVEKLKIDIEPTVVILSTRLNAFMDSGYTRRADNDFSVSGEQQSSPYEMEIRPTPDFSYDRALSKLANLETLQTDSTVRYLVPGDADHTGDVVQADEIGFSGHQGVFLQMSAWLNVDSKVSSGCAGAVVAFLQRRRASEYLQDDPDAQMAYRILHLQMFTFENTMFINADTLSSLQIITPESHPNVFNQGPGATGSKESLSVFGLFQGYARTPQGKTRLRELFLRPSLNPEQIQLRLDFVSVFTRPDNRPVCEQLSKNFSKVKNLRNVMTMLHKGVEGGNKQKSFKSGVWSCLLEFCYYAIDVAEALREVVGAENLPLCVRAHEVLDRFELRRIGKMIHDIVDLELSEEEHRTVVKRGVEAGLDQIKEVYDGIEDLLSHVAQDVARTIPADIVCQINVIFFPQLGFHITVPLAEDSRQPVWSGNGAWERMFTTNNMAYFKDQKMRQMDSELGDLWASICDVEIEIVHDLAQRILQDEQFLLRASDLCGELDCLLALAHGAVHYNLSQPRFVQDDVIRIKGGRHLLQELVVPSYVPNDTSLAAGTHHTEPDEQHDPSVLVLTGPNYSGKSVYQNAVATIVYMAHIGSFVPCEHCTLGITDKILTRTTTMETVSKAQSAFMIDLQQVALAMNMCTRQSLVVIDEFGKGTDTCDGAGLAAGVLQHFLELGSECPKVLAATHFHEIFELGLFEDELNVAHAHMEVHVDGNSSAGTRASEDIEVTYLYQLREGRSMLSYGAQCAAMHGVPKPVVGRAESLAESLGRGEDLVAICSGMGLAEMEDLQAAEAVCRRFCNADFDGKEQASEDEDIREVLQALLDGVGLESERTKDQVRSAVDTRGDSADMG